MLVQRFLNILSDLCKLDEPKEILARLENTRTLFKASKKHISESLTAARVNTVVTDAGKSIFINGRG